MIPYGRQTIDEDDIKAVNDVLRSDWLTTGPKVAEFEQAVADYVGAKYAVAVSNGTAALHAAMYAIGIGPGDEVIVPPMTLVATANCIVYQGGTPIFADVDPDTLLLDPKEVEKKITPKTKAIIGVDYAGQPCDWNKLREIATNNNLVLVADCCHAIGAEYKGRKVGSIADLNVFSFHPVKHIATGEGGMVTTDDKEKFKRICFFRNHGITTDATQREKEGTWFYEMQEMGFNYRLSDINCALGISQLGRLQESIKKRNEIAARYDNAFKDMPGIKSLDNRSDVLTANKYLKFERYSKKSHESYDNSVHAFHLYVIRVLLKSGLNRNKVFETLRKNGIGVNVHYIPVYMHPFYRRVFGTKDGLCPVAEDAYKEIISIPMFNSLKEDDVGRVIFEIRKTTGSVL